MSKIQIMTHFEIHATATRIFNNEQLSWEEKYHLIFSDEISMKVSFDWYDPDTSYEDDVVAFMNGFDKYIAKLS